MTDPARVAGLFGDTIETGNGPDFLRVVEALGVAEMGQVMGGQEWIDAGDEVLGLIYFPLPLPQLMQT